MVIHLQGKEVAGQPIEKLGNFRWRGIQFIDCPFGAPGNGAANIDKYRYFAITGDVKLFGMGSGYSKLLNIII